MHCADTAECVSNPPLSIGGSRPAAVSIPADYTTSIRYPLVIYLHAAGGSAAQAHYLGLPNRVDTRDYILLTPEGTENVNGLRIWNATEVCCAATEEEFQIDDMGYLRELIEEAALTYSIDPQRISLIGASNGAFLALRVACEHPELLSAVVSLAGSTYADANACYRGPDPVSVLALHGENDETFLYGGGQKRGNAYPGALETSSRFAELAGCDANTPLARPNLDAIESIPGSETEVLTYPDCDTGKEVEQWTIRNGSHLPNPFTATALERIADWMLNHPKQGN